MLKTKALIAVSLVAAAVGAGALIVKKLKNQNEEDDFSCSSRVVLFDADDTIAKESMTSDAASLIAFMKDNFMIQSFYYAGTKASSFFKTAHYSLSDYKNEDIVILDNPADNSIPAEEFMNLLSQIDKFSSAKYLLILHKGGFEDFVEKKINHDKEEEYITEFLKNHTADILVYESSSEEEEDETVFDVQLACGIPMTEESADNAEEEAETAEEEILDADEPSASDEDNLDSAEQPNTEMDSKQRFVSRDELFDFLTLQLLA